MKKSVAIIGMGKMGEALAKRLLDQQFELAIWNRSKKDFSEFTSRGAQILDDPSSAWSTSDVAISFLASDDAVKQVYLGENGLLTGSCAGHLAIDMSTISPEASSEVAKKATAAGVDFLRSPVSGNPGVLASGNLALIVSGPKDAFDKNLELLETVGPKVYYVGQNEESRIVKLTINATLAATTAIMAETIMLCEANGIDRKTYLDVLANSSVGSPFIKYKSEPLQKHDYSATFTTEMLGKDLRLALKLAKDSGSAALVTEKIYEIIDQTCKYGLGELDFTAILPYLQNLSGMDTDVQPS